MMSNHPIIGLVIVIGSWAVLRFHHQLRRIFILICIAPIVEYDGSIRRRYFSPTIKPSERCWACGGRDGKLKAVMKAEGKAKAQLLIEYDCNICGAIQHFAPVVPSSLGDPESKPYNACARVGSVQGKEEAQ